MSQPTSRGESIDVAVVEDDPGFRTLVHETLAQDPRCRIIAECPSAEDALVELPKVQPAVVLMDIQLGGLSGIECVRRLKEFLPGTRFMMLTVFEDYDGIYESLRAGATGYLIKREVPNRLLDAVRDLHGGESPISPAIARKLVQTFQEPPRLDNEAADLSPRERQILDGLARGRQYKEIACELGVSFHTIRTHVGRIYEKLHVHSRTEAIGKFKERG